MISTVHRLTEQYAAALEIYLSGGGEAALHQGYELGRGAVAEGVGILEMVAIHSKALAMVFGGNAVRREIAGMAERCNTFLGETLAPFEMVIRGVREANAALHLKIEEVEAAEREMQSQNEELIAIQLSLDAERRRYHELFNFAPDSYLVTDLHGKIQEANKSAAALLHTTQQRLAGKSLLDFIPPEEHSFVRNELGLLATGTLEKINLWQISIDSHDDRRLQIALTAGVMRDSDGRVLGLRCLLRDVTERQQIEDQRAELRVREHLLRAQSEVARRLKFLADASTSLANSFDYAAIPRRLATLAVPYLADCCFVYLTGENSKVQHFAYSHLDLKTDELLDNLKVEMHDSPPALAKVLDSRNSEIVTHVSEAWLRSLAGSDHNFNLLTQINCHSALLVPLSAQDRTLGAIAFFLTASEKNYSPDDWALADELARRAALTLENAGLYHEVLLAKEKAEKASRAREEFVAVLSHELRTPLMTILGWAQVFKRNAQITQNAVLEEAVHSLQHNAQNITRLVEECLDIARISEGKIQLRSDIVDLNEIAAAAFDSIRGMAETKEMAITAELSAGLNVVADATRLEEVILNLLTNAVKYTNRGGKIVLRVLRTDQCARVEVTDSGIGIEPEFLEPIFEPFRQGSTNWYASQSGLGLGLAIARDIIQMHGGKIWAESGGKGSGSTFKLELPLADSDARPNACASRQRRRDERKSPVRVLFIEDSRDVLFLMQTELERLGYSVSTALDGKTGLEIARRELPDVIVSDIKMPGFDGYQLISELRQIPELANTPAVALTGFGMKADIDRALAAGYSAHLSKPAEIDDIAALIDSLIPDKESIAPPDPPPSA